MSLGVGRHRERKPAAVSRDQTNSTLTVYTPLIVLARDTHKLLWLAPVQPRQSCSLQGHRHSFHVALSLAEQGKTHLTSRERLESPSRPLHPTAL